VADVVSAVRTYILSQSSVTDVIAQRMYLDRLKQNAKLPAATISKVSESHVHTISNRSGLVQTRLQIECFASQRLTANSLAEAIYKCGIVAVKGSTNSVDIRGVMVEDGQRNFTIDDADGGDDHLYVTQFDLLVSYLE
jgi:hypothetical protein